jgi:AraC-like DNA-binding protein
VLTAWTDVTLGPARYRALAALEREVRLVLVYRDHLASDTRLAPALTTRPPPCVHALVILEGTLTIAGEAPRPTPALLFLREDEFELVDPSAGRSFRTDGARVRLAHLRLPVAAVRVPIGLAHGARPCPDALADAGRRLMAIGESGDVALDDVRELLGALAAEGLVAPQLRTTGVADEPERFVRLWAKVRPLFGQFAPATPLRRLALVLGLSLRQITRDSQDLVAAFQLPSFGFRDVTLALRLRSALMFLTAPGVTVGEVAERVGYGSAIALARAFRQAGLPPPLEAQRLLIRRGP